MSTTGNEMLEFEGKVEHTTAKAWLVEDNMSGVKAWLPKSVGTMMGEADPDGNIIFQAPEWWMKKQGFV
jgi:hypothetical protein